MSPMVEWRSVMGESGAQCVMTFGIIEMLPLSAGSLDSQHNVSKSIGKPCL